MRDEVQEHPNEVTDEVTAETDLEAEPLETPPSEAARPAHLETDSPAAAHTETGSPEEMGAVPTSPQGEQEDESAALLSELTLLRGELEHARAEMADFKGRFLRARADLENYRRRVAQDAIRAREAGLDSAIVTVLSVYDDLGRALDVAGDDPSRLVPGLEAVREGLRRNLESLGIVEVGAKGEPFDPDLHEALTAVPTADAEAANTIAEVIQTGFLKEDRLVRPARVVVFQA